MATVTGDAHGAVRKRSRHPILGLGLVALAGCSSRPQTAERPASVPVVTVAEARRQTVPVRVQPIGTTRAIESVTARARVRGILQERAFREGAMVKKGQLLFVIEEDTYKATLDAAAGKRDQAAAALEKAKQSRSVRIAQAQLNLDKAVLALAKIEEARTRALFARNSAPASDYDKARADLDKAAAQVEADEAQLEQSRADYDVDIRSAQATLDSAEAQVRQARIDLGYCRMYSPLDGRIGEAKVKVGNLVGPNSAGGETTELATIQQLDPMGVDLEVPSRALARATRLIKAGLTATISKAGLEGEPDLTYPSVAYFIDNTINPTTSTFLIKARVDNPEGLLLPGEYVKADVTVDQLRDAVVVPESAVVETQAGPTVFTVDPQGKVAVVPVKVGVIDNGLCTITSGLDAGAAVIVGRPPSIRPGMTVKVSRPSEKAAAPAEPAR